MDDFSYLRHIQKKERTNSALSKIRKDFYEYYQNYTNSLKNYPEGSDKHYLFKDTLRIYREILERREHKITEAAIMNIHSETKMDIKNSNKWEVNFENYILKGPINLTPNEEKYYIHLGNLLKNRMGMMGSFDEKAPIIVEKKEENNKKINPNTILKIEPINSKYYEISNTNKIFSFEELNDYLKLFNILYPNYRVKYTYLEGEDPSGSRVLINGTTIQHNISEKHYGCNNLNDIIDYINDEAINSGYIGDCFKVEILLEKINIEEDMTKKLHEEINDLNNEIEELKEELTNLIYHEKNNILEQIPKKRKRNPIPKGIRHEVFKRDNYTCVECGARKSDGAVLHIDHIIPIAQGGSDELDNLQTLCDKCNLNKSDLIQRK